MTIRKEWQAKIVARDCLESLTLVRAIANRLYPELTYAADRERKLMEIPEMQRLAAICQRNAASLSAELAEWRRLEKAS